MAETDNSLPCASLYTDFSGSKKSPKDFRRSNAAAKANYTYVWLFLPICGGNGLSTSMRNPILTLFYGEKSSCEDKLSKSRSRDYSPLDNPPTVGFFCPNLNFFHLNYLYKRNRLATTVRPCNLRQNRRATGARICGFVRIKSVRKSVIFHILQQSTGLAFTTGSLTRDYYG